MSDMMTQEEAMNMSNEQAVQILIPMRNMMFDQYGCPISDAVFALDKAIKTLSTNKPQKVITQITFDEEKLHEIVKEAVERFKEEYEVTDRPQGEWIEVKSYESEKHSVTDMRCNLCGKYSQMVLPHQTKCVYPRCPFCGARMKEINNE